MYEYKAKVIRVVDGDSVWLEVDLGFRMSMRDNFRLARIDAPEIRGEERDLGLLSKSTLEAILPEGLEVTIRTEKAGKYGRWLVEIEAIDPKTNTAYNVNDHMIKIGQAKLYE